MFQFFKKCTKCCVLQNELAEVKTKLEEQQIHIQQLTKTVKELYKLIAEIVNLNSRV